ncbi:hypothetical protein SLEP1_g33040 [Rubroshorea leprosula]|uniref:Uncharacterized protein n=1 Tax=Rubroshorea leprosula TaxID=152421 RepID=A0AAV5KFD1_9ROSI|nr:hypothetical protein SLEP1_g33040 [Rubroshorea leprosula]
MQRFNKSTLDIDNVPDTICLFALLHGLKLGRFLDDLLENPLKSWNEVNDRSTSFILSEDFQSSKQQADDRQGKEHKQPEGKDEKKKQKVGEQRGKPHSFPKYDSYIPLSSSRSQILTQIQHWVKRPPPQTHDSPRVDRSKYCDYHRAYGHNIEDCQSLKDELEFLARNGKLEGYVQKPYARQPNQTHFVQEAYRGRPFNRRGQGQKTSTQNQKDHKGGGYSGIPSPSGTTNMISGGMHSGGQRVITLPIYVGIEPRFRMASVDFLVVKMESAFNAIIGRVTLCELKVVFSQPYLCMKFLTPQGVDHRPKNVEQKAEPVEPVETVPLSPDEPDKRVKIGTKLTPEERTKLLEFLKANRDVFAWTIDEMLGIPTKFVVHKLSTDLTKKPVVQKCRLVGPKKQAAIDEEIQKLLQAGFIRRVEYSEWVSNPVLVKKPNGKWRMCIDFTNLNEACPKDLHPLPNIGRNIEVYVDDMIVTSVRAEDHVDDLNETFQNLRRAQMKINPLKCTFAVKSGHLAALHRFIARSAEKCFPFFKALREPKDFQCTDECQQAFEELKQYLALPPLLSKPIEGETLYLYLGVANEALRAYFQSHEIVVYTNLPLRKILQKPELFGRLIGWAIKLSEHDLKFQPRTTIKGQVLADFLIECRPTTAEETTQPYPVWVLYVDGAANVEGSGARVVLLGPEGFKSEHALRFKFQTTNNVAEYEALIYGLKLASELKAQSIRVFSDSQLVINQVNGSCDIKDPQLSRCMSMLASSQDINPQRTTLVEVLDASSYTSLAVKCQVLITDASSPSWSTPRIDYLRTGELPEDPSDTRLIRGRAAHFSLIEDQLYKCAASMPLLRCLTPYEVESAIREDAQNYVKKCPTCQFNADDIYMPSERLSSLISPWPFAQWGVDLLDPFTKGKGGCTHLIVVVDYFTKWIEAKPLSTTTEKKIEEFLFNSILWRFGIPMLIIADNGPQFRAAALRSFCGDHSIELTLTSSNWVDEPNKVLWSCCTTPSSASSETPFCLAYGAEVVIPVEVGLSSNGSARYNDYDNE